MKNQNTDTTVFRLIFTYFKQGARNLGYISIFAAILVAFLTIPRYISDNRGLMSLLEKEVITNSGSPLSPHDEGKLISIHGVLAGEEKLTDPAFNVSLTGVVMRRIVERYKKEDSNNHRYTRFEWDPDTIFQNPDQIYQDKSDGKQSSVIFTSSHPTVNNIAIDQKFLASLKRGTRTSVYKTEGGVHLSFIPIIGDYQHPKEGDKKASFEIIQSGITVHLIGMQMNNKIIPYTYKDTFSFDEISEGKISAEDLIRGKIDENQTYLIIMLSLSTLFLVIGIYIALESKKKNIFLNQSITPAIPPPTNKIV